MEYEIVVHLNAIVLPSMVKQLPRDTHHDRVGALSTCLILIGKAGLSGFFFILTLVLLCSVFIPFAPSPVLLSLLPPSKPGYLNPSNVNERQKRAHCLLGRPWGL